MPVARQLSSLAGGDAPGAELLQRPLRRHSSWTTSGTRTGLPKPEDGRERRLAPRAGDRQGHRFATR
jgi:hypothetical protein